MSQDRIGVVEENGVVRGAGDPGVGRLVALGRALSDPIRVRMPLDREAAGALLGEAADRLLSGVAKQGVSGAR